MMTNIDFIYGECWKAIAGHSEYLISNFGRVYSTKHKKILKPYICTSYGYLLVKLGSAYKFKNYKLHRLVAETFVDNPDNKSVVHHKDGNPKNNRADNLMWVTAEEHINIHRELRQKARGQNNE